jgi:hypothetical protein
VHDLVDRERCGRTVGVLGVVGGQVFGDLGEPFVNCASGRALSAGKEPTTPALHCASTSGGCEMMKSGEPTTGIRRFFFRISGSAMVLTKIDVLRKRKFCNGNSAVMQLPLAGERSAN